MVEVFRTIATDNTWEFSYGRADFHNLEELTPGSYGLYLDPIETEKKFTQGQNEHSGRFMILLNSDLDNVYDGQKGQAASSGKYKKNIQPIKASSGPLENLENELICQDFELIGWKCLEVVNLFDQNLDGVLINFRIREFL